MWGDPASPESLPSLDFDVVIDNNGKSLEVCKPLIDAFKVGFMMPLNCMRSVYPPTLLPLAMTPDNWQMQGKVQHYMFVSSAGAYDANSVEPMHVEGDPRKKSAGDLSAFFTLTFHFATLL